MAKGPALPAVRDALDAQYARLVAGLAALDPAGPTRCARWTVADLETHLALTAESLARVAAAPVTGAATGGVAAWTQALPELAGRLDAAVHEQRRRLAEHVPAALAALDGDADAVVEQLTGRHTLRDAGTFRLVEAVVHGLDAAIEPERAALKLVVRELARALAERHPGRTVEVRIPPYAAVQCLPGPRHTRGTPPNVVECDAVAFVDLCTGRLAWNDAVRDGRVRASGERSDLGFLLPLLT